MSGVMRGLALALAALLVEGSASLARAQPAPAAPQAAPPPAASGAGLPGQGGTVPQPPPQAGGGTGPAATPPAASPGSLYPAWITTALKDLETLIRILAVLAGAVWAYFKFVKGRTFRPRLEPDVEGTALAIGGRTLIHVRLKLKNVGLSKVGLQQEGTALLVEKSAAAASQAITAVPWEHQGAFPVLADHQWIEPGEMICEQHLLSIADIGSNSLRLGFRITAQKLHWTAMAIISADLPAEKTPPASAKPAGRTNASTFV